MGKSRRNGFVEKYCDTGLGLMMETHNQSSFPYKNMNQMVMPQHGSNSLSFTSSGGMVTVNVRVLFSASQRAELEAQTLIYKYIMACVPVPQQLLHSITNTSPNEVRKFPRLCGVREMYEGLAGRLDPEPWRCRRTDGKKWRCSRDTAIDQKYCERHCHRKRSRKRVESSIPDLLNINKDASIPSPRPRPSAFKSYDQSPFSNPMVTHETASDPQTRALEWSMKVESVSVAASNREWEQLMPFKLGLNSHTSKCGTDVDFSKQQNERSFNLYKCGSQGLHGQRSHDNLGGALNSNRAQETRHFIDAWSTERAGKSIDELGKRKRDTVSFNMELLPLSSLTLSMSGENIEANVENRNRQMGDVVLGSERHNATTQWMSPLSWMSTTPGGPLGEALCLGIASSNNILMVAETQMPMCHAWQECDLINRRI